MTGNKLIVRVMGGLGNQLFCYAAARRLAHANEAELVVDHVSGFKRDFRYKRQYGLEPFALSARLARNSETLEPFERVRRAIKKTRALRQAFNGRKYLSEELRGFDQRILDFRFQGTIFLDGLWQSEKFFLDIEDDVRREFQIAPPADECNQRIAAQIAQADLPVALHVRWFDDPSVASSTSNVALKYYQRAVEQAAGELGNPHFFVFSDDPKATKSRLSLAGRNCTFVDHNHGDDKAYADMWLMSQCRHFITANSTFSWWGAWLCPVKEKLVYTPNPDLLDESNAWTIPGLLPDSWTKI